MFPTWHHIGLSPLHHKQQGQKKLFFKILSHKFALIMNIEKFNQYIKMPLQHFYLQLISKFKEDDVPDMAITENSDSP